RDRAVAKAVHLVETARLEARRHQIKIATRLDAMRQTLIEAQPHRHLGRITSRERLIRLFVNWRPAAEQDKLHVRPEHFLQRAELDIEALLIGETRDAAKERDVGFYWQTKFLLKIELVEFLSRELADGKRMRQAGIAGRAPFLVIDTVEDAEKHIVTLAQKAVETAAVLGRGDLARITGAHRGQDIRGGDARLEAIQHPVKFRAVRIEIIQRQVRELVCGGGKNSLVR